MAKDKWLDGTANWDTPSDWSAGLPSASTNVLVAMGNPEVTASFGTVNSITDLAVLTFIDAGASSVARSVTNSYKVALDEKPGEGGSSLTIGGTLTNYGTLSIGNHVLSAASTVDAAKIVNFDPADSSVVGIIDLIGFEGGGEATLDIRSAAGFGAAGVLYGHVSLYHDVLLEFARGQIATIAADGTLGLFGPHAFVADASDTSSNSALKGLKTVAGTLELDSGTTVVTSGGLINSGEILDFASSLTIGGTLTNSGNIEIEAGSSPTAGSTLEDAKIVNDGRIDLVGGKGIQAGLHTGGAFTNDGSVNLSHDTDTIGGAVSGTGNFTLSTSTLEFVNGVLSGETVTFGPGVNHLYLDSPSSFGGTIDAFSTPGDSVIAKGFAEAATTLAYTQGTDSCSWTLTDSTHTAVINFAGAPYAQSDFSISPSANGATLIKFA
jgi:hypothetical protein